MQKIKHNIMSDFILDKQEKREAKTSASTKTSAQKGQIFVKPLLVLIALLGFIVMSLNNNNLFLTELLISGGIIFIVALVYVITQFNTTHKG